MRQCIYRQHENSLVHLEVAEEFKNVGNAIIFLQDRQNKKGFSESEIRFFQNCRLNKSISDQVVKQEPSLKNIIRKILEGKE